MPRRTAARAASLVAPDFVRSLTVAMDNLQFDDRSAVLRSVDTNHLFGSPVDSRQDPDRNGSAQPALQDHRDCPSSLTCRADKNLRLGHRIGRDNALRPAVV